MTDSRDPASSSGGGERAIWVLIAGVFALGVLSFVTSFGGGTDSAAASNDNPGSEDGSDQAEGGEDGLADDGTAIAGESTTPAPSGAADSFTISASGDILIHERVAEAAAAADGGYDFDPLFAPVQNLIASRDFAICHLEVPISSTNDDLSFSEGVFRAPSELADALRNAGFDSCSVASNHSWDSGEASVISTIEQLQRVGLPHVGIANTPEESTRSWQFDVRGNIVGHLSYTFGLNGREPGEVPAERVAQIDEQRILADAAQQRANGSEFVIVSMHWGTEFQNAPDDQQADLGPRLLASPDIDLIIGHHAHVPQPVVAIDGEYIAYGLGNLLSNQAQGIPECPTLCPLDSQDGVLLDFVVERRDDGTLGVTEVIANPTWVDNRNTWRIISTDAPAAIGAEVETAILEASGQRTRGSLAIQ